MKTLIDVLPYEFETEFSDTKAYSFKDVKVIEEKENVNIISVKIQMALHLKNY